ncbi:uncharacterized protein KY384_004822 [Bacidia gigantensis]|uniref:uncharacterized protein n=1 Tax=Bacidia gigantensis TaxID=2732470 RepID=UPI001D0537E7|nr:uncharacterized protein KY384_004822 [Bacidia gigantensis]KAG8530320.1 hypothetical protein KY384_004822 [Bacidia gigantensis]
MHTATIVLPCREVRGRQNSAALLKLLVTQRLQLFARFTGWWASYQEAWVEREKPMLLAQGSSIRIFQPRLEVKERREKGALPETPARTRFAPSPTGYLHLGSLRTALFNYLIAKATNGQFILRLEDTDKKRTVADSEQRLYEDLQWAGLQWDEGPVVGGPRGPYRQSERTNIYTSEALELIKSGHGYRCFCSQERLQTIAEKRRLEGFWTDYDRECFSISPEDSEARATNGDAHVIRLKTPDMIPPYTDLIYGKFPGQRIWQSGNYEDPVLIKSDGNPTYHLANVVDDHHMEISHVIRATEWLPSTPKHITLYNAFGWKPPVFAHVGLLQDSNKRKLSKRAASDTLKMFRESGYLPEALINYLALMGWSHKLTSDFMTMQDLIHNVRSFVTHVDLLTGQFDLKFTKGDVNVATEKLGYLQAKYAKLQVATNGPHLDKMVVAVHRKAALYLASNPE